MNRNVIIAIVVAVVVVAFAAIMFTTNSQVPDQGPGPTRDENVEAATPEPGAEPTAN
jgi:hypothetical protein